MVHPSTNAAIKTGRSANLAGSLWMIASMAAFAVEDVFFKAAAAILPHGQILTIFGICGALVFALVARFKAEPLLIPDVLSRPMLIRFSFEITGRLFYFLAVALIPLSVATVILQAAPLVVVAGAVLIFGERASWRSWAAILVGFGGVLMILQPATEGFTALSILAVIGMLGFAGRDLASRGAPSTIGTLLLGFYGFLAVIVAGVLLSIWQGEAFVVPSLIAALAVGGALLFGLSAYVCLMKAMRTGDVSAVTPFRYTRLLFGIGAGVLIFGDEISLSMAVGTGLIVGAGIFLLWPVKRVTLAGQAAASGPSLPR
jgi:drug/metabolite transporter (DMT)-like permease